MHSKLTHPFQQLIVALALDTLIVEVCPIGTAQVHKVWPHSAMHHVVSPLLVSQSAQSTSARDVIGSYHSISQDTRQKPGISPQSTVEAPCGSHSFCCTQSVSQQQTGAPANARETAQRQPGVDAQLPDVASLQHIGRVPRQGGVEMTSIMGLLISWWNITCCLGSLPTKCNLQTTFGIVPHDAVTYV